MNKNAFVDEGLGENISCWASVFLSVSRWTMFHPNFQMKGGDVAPVDSVVYWQFSKLERAAAVTTARQHRSNSLLSNNGGGAPHTSRWPSFTLMLPLRIWPPSLWSSSFVHDNVQVVNMQGARGRCSLSRSIYTSSAFVATQPCRWTLVQLCDHAAECR